MIVIRSARLPLACAVAFGVFVFTGFVLGSAYGIVSQSKPKTCAMVQTSVGTAFTCEYGHHYHDELEQMGQS